MPIITRPEEETEVFGLLDELSPAPEEKTRARQSVLSDALEQTIPALAQTAVERTIEDLRDPRRLTQAQALSEAEVRGLVIGGIGESGISVGGLNVILRRAHRRNERQRQIEAGDLSGAEQLGLSFLGQAPDPINILPFGAATKSATVVGAVAKGVAVGAGATAVVEPAYFALSRQAGIDYTLADSAANIAFGAALGGTFGGAGYAYSQVASSRERRAVLPVITRQAANDEAIDVSAALPEGVPDVIINPREAGSEFTEVGPDDVSPVLPGGAPDVTVNSREAGLDGVPQRSLETSVPSSPVLPGGAPVDADLGNRIANLSEQQRLGLLDEIANLSEPVRLGLLDEIANLSEPVRLGLLDEIARLPEPVRRGLVGEIARLPEPVRQELENAIASLREQQRQELENAIASLPERDRRDFENQTANPREETHREVVSSGVTLNIFEGTRSDIVVAKLGGDIPDIELDLSRLDRGKTLHVNSIFPIARGFITRQDANILGPRTLLKVYRALREAYPGAEKISGYRVTGARQGPVGARRLSASATVPLRARRGPAAVDSSVAIEADAIDEAAVTAKPEAATTVLPLEGEAAELDTRLNDELAALDPEAREAIDAEFRGIDESFADEATYVSTIRAAVTCALTTGVDNVV